MTMKQSVWFLVLLFAGCGPRIDQPDPFREMRAQERIEQTFRDAIVQKVQTDGLGSLSQVEQDFFLLDVFDREVRNGGFSQFFQSAAGNRWEDTREALKRCGWAEVQELFSMAVTVFIESRPPANREARQLLIDAFSEETNDFLDSLDRKYRSLHAYIMGKRIEIAAQESAAAPASRASTD